MQAKTPKAYLLLENGMTLEGYSFGAPVGYEGVVGEVVFTTAMTGTPARATTWRTLPSSAALSITYLFIVSAPYLL